MEFKNVEKFEAWISENAKQPQNTTAVLAEIEENYGNTGSKDYEIHGRESKSGKTESYRFNVENHFFLDETEVAVEDYESAENETQTIETTIIF